MITIFLSVLARILFIVLCLFILVLAFRGQMPVYLQVALAIYLLIDTVVEFILQ